ncbi:hypothetical protein KIN20_018496 [Parelaphostrongylus tenuis]|uniref:Uncharacterized protein n=1 Tax=Parelaphostrongylus tenuis TaxID=148309 RepID=A0AAD5QPN3_PARTN|nr:hypothetical protein KIN20_018496 [Parelaphostrongylus tenuis]
MKHTKIAAVLISAREINANLDKQRRIRRRQERSLHRQRRKRVLDGSLISHVRRAAITTGEKVSTIKRREKFLEYLCDFKLGHCFHLEITVFTCLIVSQSDCDTHRKPEQYETEEIMNIEEKQPQLRKNTWMRPWHDRSFLIQSAVFISLGKFLA